MTTEPAEARKARKPKPASDEAWGILNPWGDLWTHHTFSSPEEATAYIKTFWSNFKTDQDTSRFKVVRVKVRVSALAPSQ